MKTKFIVLVIIFCTYGFGNCRDIHKKIVGNNPVYSGVLSFTNDKFILTDDAGKKWVVSLKDSKLTFPKMLKLARKNAPIEITGTGSKHVLKVEAIKEKAP